MYTATVLYESNSMKNITLSADEYLIEKAREKARSHNTTLNAEFRLWLEQYAAKDSEGERRVSRYQQIMTTLSDEIDTGGRKFTRDEMNER